MGDDMTLHYPEGLVPQGISAELIQVAGLTPTKASDRHDRRDPGWAAADILRRGDENLLPANQLVNHAGQLVAAVRRQCRRIGHHQRRRRQARSAPAGAHPHRDGGGPGPAPHADRVISATEKVVRRAGLTLADVDLFEVNEAFAPVVLAWAQDTGADLAKTNVNGGAIAIGHPLGPAAPGS